MKRFLAVLTTCFFGLCLLYPPMLYAPAPSLATSRSCIDYSEYLRFEGWIGVNVYDAAVAGGHAYIVDGVGLKVIDVRAPASPVVAGSVNFCCAIHNVAVSGDHAYVTRTGGHGFSVIDIGAPDSPSLVATITGFYPRGVAVVGNYAFLAENGLHIVDVSVPGSPFIAASIQPPLPTVLTSVAVVGGLAYVGGERLVIFNVENPLQPYLVGTAVNPGFAEAVVVSDGYAFVADGSAGLTVIDVDPPQPRSPVVGSVATPGPAVDVALWNNTAFVADEQSRLHAIDVTTPTSPVTIGSFGIPSSSVSSVAVEDDRAYVGFFSGFEILDVSSLATPNVEAVGTPGEARGVDLAGDYAYVADGDWLQVVDVSAGAPPSIVGSVDIPQLAARDVAVSGDYAYVVTPGDIFVVDVSTPASPAIVGSAGAGGFGGVDVLGNYAYVAGSGGLRVVDISTPTLPTIAASIGQFASDVTVKGDYAYVAAGNLGLQVIDISVPPSPTIVGSAVTSDAAGKLTVFEDHAYVALDNGVVEVIDVRSPTTPVVIDVISVPLGAKDLAASGGYLYVKESYDGLHVLDIGDPAAWSSVGFATVATQRGFNSVAVSGGCVALTGLDGLYVLASQCRPATGIRDVPMSSATRLWNAPNPFNPSTVIFYEIPHSGHVTIAIYTITGELVDVLVDGYQTGGPHRIVWNGRNSAGETVSSGVYISTFKGEGVTRTNKLVLLK